MSRAAWMVLLSALGLAGAILSSRPVMAQEDPVACEPLTETSLEAVGERFDLGDDQLAWLRARFRAGALRRPDDLDGMPGLGPELRDRLEAAWCWSRPWPGRGDFALRARRDGWRRELRVSQRTAAAQWDGRLRWDHGQRPMARGALVLRRAGWLLAAGTLRARQALGLVVVTPGAEPRGNAPLRPGGGGWRPTLGMDPETVSGVAAGRVWGSWCIEGGWIRSGVSGAGAGRQSWTTLSARWRRGSRHAGILLGGSGREPLASLDLGGAGGPGKWTLEWAWGTEGTSQGVSWEVAAGRWRLRSSLVRRGAGFRARWVRLYRNAAKEEGGQFRLEARWQGGSGRFVRMSAAEERGVGGSGASWSAVESVRALELGERIHPDLRVLVLWRSRLRRDDGSGQEEAGRQRLARAQFLYRRRGWRADLRLEERSAEGGRSRLTALRFGRSGRWQWRLEAGRARFEGDGPDLWWYRRRAGGLYGWDRLAAGTWVGVWGRIPRRGWSVDLSAANRPDGWEGGAAVRLLWGRSGGVDPTRQDP